MYRVAGVGEQLPFAGASFDAVVIARLLYLVPEWQTLLRDVRRVLRPGGRVPTASPEPSALSPQPSYCSTFNPAFQSLAKINPSFWTKMSAVFGASEMFGRGSTSFFGVGGIQYAISLGEN